MRVLHVSQPVEGGAAAVVAGLLTDQLGRGWAPVLACPPGRLAKVAADLGVEVREWAAARSPGPSTGRETRALRRLVAAVAPDVVHLHSAKAGLAGRLAVRGALPTVYQPHGWSFDAATGLLRAAAQAWERAGSRWTHRLVCVSADELAAGRAVGVRGPAVVVPNGVDIVRFRPRDRTAARARLELAEAPTVLCMGRVTEQKGQDRLLAAWPAVRAATPAAVLVIAGDGPATARWRGADPSVRWIGAVDDAEHWYAAADVVAVPSRWGEGMALVPLEAMASGRSVVASDVNGMRESIGPAGRVVAADDPVALAAALTARLADPALAAREGAAGRQRVLAAFDVARAAEATAAVATELAGDLR